MADIGTALGAWFRVITIVSIWVILAAVFMRATIYLWSRSFGDETATVNIKNEKGEDRSARFVARTAEVLQPLQLDRFYELYVPKLSSGYGVELAPLPAGTKLEVKGIDLWAMFRLMDEAIRKDIPTVEGTLSESAGTFELSVTDPRAKSKRTSTLRLTSTEQGNPRQSELVFDKGIYRSLYYLNYGRDEGRRDASMSAKIAFTSPEALEAYYAGRWHLEAYQSLHDPSELDRAEVHLSSLRQLMPKFADGLVLLGITLTELRKEDEAIAIFEQLEHDLSASTDVADQRRVVQARLYGGTALRKRYTASDNSAAVTKLALLAQDIEVRRTAKTPNDVATDFLKLQIAALTELVSAVGHYQVLLHANNFSEELRSADPLVRLTNDEGKEAENPDPIARESAFQNVRARLLEVHETLKAEVDKKLEMLRKQLDSASWPSEEARYLSRVRNAHGYTLYRYAERISDEKLFKKHCQAAVKELRRAEADDPQNYATLQNLAVALLDRRYDPKGSYIDEAKRLTERSLALKPRDYYGYQLLAEAIIRRADLWGPEVVGIEDAGKAVTSAEKARSLRPFSRSILPVLISAYAIKWELANPQDKAATEAQIQTTFGTARRHNAPRLALAESRLRWLSARVRSSGTREEFEAHKNQVVTTLAELDGALADTPAGLERTDVSRRRDAFIRVFKTLTLDKRKELAWPVV